MPKQDEAVLSCFTLPWGSTALFLSVNSAACCITDPEKVDGILVRAASCLGAVSFLACQSMSVNTAGLALLQDSEDKQGD